MWKALRFISLTFLIFIFQTSVFSDVYQNHQTANDLVWAKLNALHAQNVDNEAVNNLMIYANNMAIEPDYQMAKDTAFVKLLKLVSINPNNNNLTELTQNLARFTTLSSDYKFSRDRSMVNLMNIAVREPNNAAVGALITTLGQIFNPASMTQYQRKSTHLIKLVNAVGANPTDTQLIKMTQNLVSSTARSIHQPNQNGMTINQPNFQEDFRQEDRQPEPQRMVPQWSENTIVNNLGPNQEQ
jgi:hypothetical protein